MLGPSLNSFRDPGYDDIEARVATQLGIPVEALRAVRVAGERSNANQVSPAGARTVYQVTPQTRRGLQRTYGVDAWSGPKDAALAAGHLLQENYARAGNWPDALRMYHGGPDRRRWGPVNRAYGARTAPMVANIGASTAQIPADQEITDSYNPRYAEASMDQSPEPTKVVEGGTALQPVAAATAQRHRGGLLSLLGRIAMPDPNSLWAGALRGGLVNARESQANYQQQRADEQAARQAQLVTRQAAELALKQHLTSGTYTPVGNNVLHTDPTGHADLIEPTPQPTENMRLLDLWQHTPPGHFRDLIEHAIRGAQLDPAVIAALGAQRIAAAQAGAGTREATTRRTEQRRHYDPPTGYQLLPPEQH